MAEIKSSYRFIPVVSQQRYYSPEWKDHVSHDIPFEDEVSGEITYKLKANTPIFIKGDDGNFCNIGGKYFIPGSSIKGCIRSVLEIMSFGHLDDTRVKNNKERYPFRDIQDRNGYMTKMSNVHCGWLTNNNEIVNWGVPIQIRYDDILTRIPNCSFNQFRNKNVFEKYSLTGGYLTGTFSTPAKLLGAKHYDKRLFTKFKDGGHSGTIVFSGAMTSSKKSDFVLLDKDENSNPINNISREVINAFRSIYPNYMNIPFNRAKGGRAVFFTMDGNNRVVSIGLSYLHKYYAQKSIRDALPEQMRGGEPDLADIIFGSAKYNLKGRVQFSALMGDDKVEPLLNKEDTILTVLGSPRASYYPTYLQERATWDSDNALISGIKRYPIKPKYDISILEGNDLTGYQSEFGATEGKVYETKVLNRKLIPRDTERKINFDTVTKIKPLKEDSTFSGTIRFHNLKKVELGALLSALTFHGKEDECKHSLGQAKSHGYGSVSITIKEIKTNRVNDKATYLEAFADLMNGQMKNILGKDIQWLETNQIKELQAMAKGFESEDLIDVFTPMLLEEFGRVKGAYMGNRDTFSSFTKLIDDGGENNSPTPTLRNRQQRNVIQTVTETATAKVTVFSGRIKQARLIEGNDNSNKELDMANKNTKLKTGDKIEVEKILRGGNVTKLKFIKKLQ